MKVERYFVKKSRDPSDHLTLILRLKITLESNDPGIVELLDDVIKDAMTGVNNRVIDDRRKVLAIEVRGWKER